MGAYGVWASSGADGGWCHFVQINARNVYNGTEQEALVTKQAYEREREARGQKLPVYEVARFDPARDPIGDERRVSEPMRVVLRIVERGADPWAGARIVENPKKGSVMACLKRGLMIEITPTPEVGKPRYRLTVAGRRVLDAASWNVASFQFGTVEVSTPVSAIVLSADLVRSRIYDAMKERKT